MSDLYRLIDPYPDDCPTYIRETGLIYHEGFIEFAEPVGTLTVTPGQVVHVFYDGGVPSGKYLIVPLETEDA